MCRCCGCQPLFEPNLGFWVGILALACRVILLLTERRLLRKLTTSMQALTAVGYPSVD